MTAESTRRILIVDDEHTVSDTLSLIFKSKGYNVITAYDAEAALVLSETLHPDVIISDVMLPGMNGIDFAILMREASPDCRVILISGHPGTADVVRNARDRGHTFELLPKPCHPTDLLARVSGTTAPI